MNSMNGSYETIVIGGGIVGASAAYHLARDGIQTLLIDRDDPGRSTDAGTGVVSTESSGHGSGAMYQFMTEAARYYPDVVSDIGSTVDVDHGYSRCGTLSVAISEDERSILNTFKQRVRELHQEDDRPPAETFYEVSPPEAERLFPPLSDVVDAFYYEGGARVDGRLMNRALLRAGQEYGLDTLEARGRDRNGGGCGRRRHDRRGGVRSRERRRRWRGVVRSLRRGSRHRYSSGARAWTDGPPQSQWKEHGGLAGSPGVPRTLSRTLRRRRRRSRRDA